VVSAEYQEHFGEHAYDEQGNYIGPAYDEADAGSEAGPSAEVEAEPEAVTLETGDADLGDAVEAVDVEPGEAAEA
jgi:hypothetical protein